MATVSVNTYDQGDVVRLDAIFKVGTTLTDPTTVTLKVKDPAGNTTSHVGVAGGLSNPSVGLWRRDEPVTVQGEYWYRWEGTGAAQADEEGRFYVRERQVA